MPANHARDVAERKSSMAAVGEHDLGIGLCNPARALEADHQSIAGHQAFASGYFFVATPASPLKSVAIRIARPARSSREKILAVA
jgi:hypothetical protein